MSPWNKGSGLYRPNDPALGPIEASTAPRLAPFRAGIEAARDQLDAIAEADGVARRLQARTKATKRVVAAAQCTHTAAMVAPAPMQKRNAAEVEAAFDAVPPQQVAEIIAGQLLVSPRPRPLHARVATRIGARLEGPFDRGIGGPGGWVLLIEPELHLGDGPDKLVPDLAGWRVERFPAGAFDEAAPAFLSVAPDWVCELLSPRTEATDRSDKLMIYAREGVGHAWLVNPALDTLEVYRLERGMWVVAGVHRGPVTVRIEPFDEAPIDLGSIWVDKAR